MLKSIALLAVLTSSVACAAEVDPPDFALAHPPVDASYSCSEHFAGQFKHLGDALGADCVPQRLVDVEGRLWSRAFVNDGASNEDWFGWQMDLLSPCDCEVASIHVNEIDNVPGVMGKGRASSIEFKQSDGVHFTYAHVREIRVKAGDIVVAGQPVAKIGNNGYSRHPHVHVAAWVGETALQIRWDQTKMKLPPEFREQQQAK